MTAVDVLTRAPCRRQRIAARLLQDRAGSSHRQTLRSCSTPRRRYVWRHFPPNE